MGLVWDGPRVGWGHGEGAWPGCGMQEEAHPAWMEAVPQCPCSLGQGRLREDGAARSIPSVAVSLTIPRWPACRANFILGARPRRP